MNISMVKLRLDWIREHVSKMTQSERMREGQRWFLRSFGSKKVIKQCLGVVNQAFK